MKGMYSPRALPVLCTDGQAYLLVLLSKVYMMGRRPNMESGFCFVIKFCVSKGVKECVTTIMKDAAF